MKFQNVLEVGSGTLTTHTHLDNAIHIDISREGHHIENVCDAHRLPFADNVFDLVYCSHVLEHCYNPIKVLNELKRVSRNTVVVAVPNFQFYKTIGECDEHLYSWNANTLSNLLLKTFVSVDVKTKFKVRESGGQAKKVFTYLFFGTLKLIFRADNDLVAVCKKG